MKTKCISLATVLLLCVLEVHAQQGINYKAIIHDDKGDVLANTPVEVRFTVLRGSSDISYQEIHSRTSDDNGIIILIIGSGTVLHGDLDTINWGSAMYGLGTEIDTGGGMTNMGQVRLQAVPYALHAEKAEELLEPLSLAEVLEKDNAAHAQIKQLEDPTEEQDATTMGYVSDQVVLLRSEIRYLKMALSAAGIPTMYDVDGNAYRTVRIGDQLWMAENLKTSMLKDLSPMNYGEDMGMPEPTYFWYIDDISRPPDSTSYREQYGALYNLAAVSSGMLCPEGWRVPLDEDWIELELYLGLQPDDVAYGPNRGRDEYVGAKLKAIDGWRPHDPPPVHLINESGFSAMGGGIIEGIHFDMQFYVGTWWGRKLDRMEEYSVTRLWYNEFGVDLERADDRWGMSVRCISNERPNGCLDKDGDGFGVGESCLGPDCNDLDYRINPSEEEFCNGIDDNCNGEIDEGCVPE